MLNVLSFFRSGPFQILSSLKTLSIEMNRVCGYVSVGV